MKFMFSDWELLRAGVGRHTDAGCRGLRAVVTETSVRFEVRHKDGRDERLGEFVRPIPRPGDPGFIRHMPIVDARLEATRRRATARDLATTTAITFRQDMETFLTTRTWKKVERGTTAPHVWRQRMTLHCEAILDRPTAGLTTEDIAQVIRTVLARRVVMRRGKPCTMVTTARFLSYFIRQVIDVAMHGEHKDRWPKGAANPCSELKYHVAIPSHNKRRQPHHPSMRIQADEHGGDVADFYARLVLHKRRTRTPRAVRWLLLTLCPRVSEVRLATWGQMHLFRDEPEWHIPDPNMKVSKDRPNGVRIVPLSRAAVDFLISFRPDDAGPDDYVFPGQKIGQPLSEGAMRGLLLQYRIVDSTLHGMRTSMVNWTAEFHPDLNEAAELALDHELTLSASRPAYHTNSLLRPRRLLAELWSVYLESKLPHPPVRLTEPAPRHLQLVTSRDRRQS